MIQLVSGLKETVALYQITDDYKVRANTFNSLVLKLIRLRAKSAVLTTGSGDNEILECMIDDRTRSFSEHYALISPTIRTTALETSEDIRLMRNWKSIDGLYRMLL